MTPWDRASVALVVVTAKTPEECGQGNIIIGDPLFGPGGGGGGKREPCIPDKGQRIIQVSVTNQTSVCLDRDALGRIKTVRVVNDRQASFLGGGGRRLCNDDSDPSHQLPLYTMQYDARNRRTRKTSLGLATRYAYGSGDELIAEETTSGHSFGFIAPLCIQACRCEPDAPFKGIRESICHSFCEIAAVICRNRALGGFL